MKILNLPPMEIEKESFRIITAELGDRPLDPEQAPIVKRVIHTTADFDYADNLYFSPDAVALAKAAIRGGATVVTDTQMALAGINKKTLARFGGEVRCFMSDEDVAAEAKRLGVTRARISMDKVIGVPVGFVNVVASKELILQSPVPCIVARGRKGGSNVAACIVNALLYALDPARGS